MVEEAKDVLRIETQLAVRDGAGVERVKVAHTDVAAEEDRVCGVQVDDLHDESADVVGVRAAEPSWSADGDVLRVLENDFAVCVGVADAVEGADVDEAWYPVGSVRREELVEERCGAVEQDGLWSEEEVGVCGFGVLVAVELVLGQNALIVRVAGEDVGLVASVVGECGQLAEVGVVECVVVAEEEIGAR